MPLCQFDAFIELINSVLLADVQTLFSYYIFWAKSLPFFTNARLPVQVYNYS